MTTASLPSTVDLILGETPHLRVVARRFTRCDADIDDLVQETLLKAFRARARFQPGTSIRAWTTTILRRLYLTNVTRAKRRGLQTDTDSGGTLESAVGRPVSPADGQEPDAAAIGEGFADSVKQAFGRLPEIYRTCFFHSVIGELSCEEIGQRLRVPVGTVMSRIHRARERLRDELSPLRGTFRAPALLPRDWSMRRKQSAFNRRLIAV